MNDTGTMKTRGLKRERARAPLYVKCILTDLGVSRCKDSLVSGLTVWSVKQLQEYEKRSSQKRKILDEYGGVSLSALVFHYTRRRQMIKVCFACYSCTHVHVTH
jgi:hypothetical protein